MMLGIACLLLALATSPSSAGPTIVVNVQDQSGEMLPGASIELIPWGECPESVIASATSDGQGVARLSIPKKGFYSIRFELEGFLGGTVGPMKLPMGFDFHPIVRMYAFFTQDVGPPKSSPQGRSQVPLVEITHVPK